jgi:CBS domain-containing protein
MTSCPITIGAEQTLAAAHRAMRARGVRHLPVLRAGELVGVVSQRDLYFLETLAGVDPERVAVAEAMTAQPYAVEPSAPLRRVASEMARRKLGCALVVDRGQVLGLFSTTDALELLAELLEQTRKRAPAPRPPRVRRAR